MYRRCLRTGSVAVTRAIVNLGQVMRSCASESAEWHFVNGTGNPYYDVTEQTAQGAIAHVIPYIEGKTKRLAWGTDLIPEFAKEFISFMLRERQIDGPGLQTKIMPSGSSILFYDGEVVGLNEGLGDVLVRKSASSSTWNYMIPGIMDRSVANGDVWSKILRIICDSVNFSIMSDGHQSKLELELKIRGTS